jgi:hypothetical protein
MMRYFSKQNPSSSLIENKVIKKVTFDVLENFKLQFQLIRKEEAEAATKELAFMPQLY